MSKVELLDEMVRIQHIRDSIPSNHMLPFLKRIAVRKIIHEARALWFIKSYRTEECAKNLMSQETESIEKDIPALISRPPHRNPCDSMVHAHVLAARFFAGSGFAAWCTFLFFDEQEFNPKYFREKFLLEANRRRALIGLRHLNGELNGAWEDVSDAHALEIHSAVYPVSRLAVQRRQAGKLSKRGNGASAIGPRSGRLEMTGTPTPSCRNRRGGRATSWLQSSAIHRGVNGRLRSTVPTRSSRQKTPKGVAA